MSEENSKENKINTLERREDIILELTKASSMLNDCCNAIIDKYNIGQFFMPSKLVEAYTNASKCRDMKLGKDRAAIKCGDIASLHVIYLNKKEPLKSVISIKSYSFGDLEPCQVIDYPVSQIFELKDYIDDSLEFYRKQDEAREKYFASKRVFKRTQKNSLKFRPKSFLKPKSKWQ